VKKLKKSIKSYNGRTTRRVKNRKRKTNKEHQKIENSGTTTTG